jgi:uncharacterized protein (DUF885 family)
VGVQDGRARTSRRLALAILVGLSSSQQAHSQKPVRGVDAEEARLEQVARAYERLQDQRYDRAGLANPSPAALTAIRTTEDRLAEDLSAIHGADLRPAEAALYAALRWRLGVRRELRICRSELWDVDHIGGWQVTVPQSLAQIQAATPQATTAALARAAAVARHVDLDIANLRRGLAAGYSAPRSVVVRVIDEIDALVALPPERSPLFEAARAAADPAFATRWRAEVEASVLPAMRRYRSFLAADYLPRARMSLGLSALPNGAACYAAYLHRATTLDWSAQQAFSLGEATVAQAELELGQIGRRRFGVSDPAVVLELARKAPDNRFGSAQDLLAFSRRALERTVAMSAPLFIALPTQPVVAEPLPGYQQDAGIPSHYESQDDPAKPAVFRISLSDWRSETLGAAEVTTSHETVPGHHMQIATARALLRASQHAGIGYNQAYVEGWANYAERLAEEAGIYTSDYAKIFRRAVLGRSLVLDPGVHVFGWSRSEAIAYMAKAGLSRQAADDLIDRIAVQPAQLTAYESGGLEIYNLREEARRRLGPRFQLSAFHQRVLERGVVTLDDLARYIRSWDGSS